MVVPKQVSRLEIPRRFVAVPEESREAHEGLPISRHRVFAETAFSGGFQPFVNKRRNQFAKPHDVAAAHRRQRARRQSELLDREGVHILEIVTQQLGQTIERDVAVLEGDRQIQPPAREDLVVQQLMQSLHLLDRGRLRAQRETRPYAFARVTRDVVGTIPLVGPHAQRPPPISVPGARTAPAGLLGPSSA